MPEEANGEGEIDIDVGDWDCLLGEERGGVQKQERETKKREPQSFFTHTAPPPHPGGHLSLPMLVLLPPSPSRPCPTSIISFLPRPHSPTLLVHRLFFILSSEVASHHHFCMPRRCHVRRRACRVHVVYKNIHLSFKDLAPMASHSSLLIHISLKLSRLQITLAPFQLTNLGFKPLGGGTIET